VRHVYLHVFPRKRPAVIVNLFTTLKIKARSVNLKIACVIHMDMHVHELLNKINAVKHSLFAHSLISANEEGGTALLPALLCWKFVLEQFMCSSYSRALDQFSPYLNNNEREW